MFDLNKKISVIIPAYNRQDLILESIHSVLTQNYTNLEVIVVDNGSTDDTINCVARLKEPRITLICEPKRGAACARNAGVRAATGDVLAFLDSDDLWLPDKLTLQLKKLDQGAEMAFTEYREFVGEDHLAPQDRGLATLSLSVITLMIRKADFLRVGFFDESLRAGEFMEWYARALRLPLQESRLDQVLSLRRIHPGNATANGLAANSYIHACRAILSKRRSG